MAYLSGQPLYCYELCRELKKQGHDVTMMSELHIPMGQRADRDGHKLVENLRAEGIECVEWNRDKAKGFDLILMSEPQSRILFDTCGDTTVFNIVHSEYDCECPIEYHEQIKAYICIRPSIAAHIITQHNISPDLVKVIYNGVDRERFNHDEMGKKFQNQPGLEPEWPYKIVAPCTLDKLREKFLNYLIDSASPERHVVLVGMDCGAELHSSPYVEIKPDTFNIEGEMADANEVAGILLGRVNLEAWSLGIKSTIFDPETLEHYTVEPPEDVDKKHNIKNVVKQILDLYSSL